MPKRKTTEEFIADARRVHGDRYIYSKVEYINSSTKVIITCPTHGDFAITPNNHLKSRQGCKQCAHERIGALSRLSKEEFIKRAQEKHAGKYSYDKVVYRDSHTKVIITCPIHGDFEQLPYHHLNGHGCKKCATALTKQKESISLDEFIARSEANHTIRYNYSNVVLNGLQSYVRIICPIHGEFEQLAQTHLQGSDCPSCAYMEAARKRAKTLQQFIEEARKVHGDNYDYSDTIYISAKKKVAIRCKKHNFVFKQKPNAHLNGNGCPICAHSHLASEIQRLLESQGVKYEIEKTFGWLADKGNLFLDFFLPEKSIAIECQGEQHFHAFDFFGGAKGLETIKRRDSLKRHLCEEHGIKVLYFSNLGIEYPYPVIENPTLLLQAINDPNETDPSRWKDPQLPLVFD